MAVVPLKVGTLGLIAGISRTLLAMASLGLVDDEAPEPVQQSNGSGGVLIPVVAVTPIMERRQMRFAVLYAGAYL